MRLFYFCFMNSRDLKQYCSTIKRSARKGRSEARISRRDEKIVARFYYYAEILKLNYSTILSKLSEEFDIDETVVSVRLKERQAVLDKFFKDKPTVRLLRRQYPFYAW